MRTSLVKTLGAFLLVACLMPAVASAEPPPESPPPSYTLTAPGTRASGVNLRGLSVWGILPSYSGIGVGGRFMIPLALQPVVHASNVHDSFALEVGADLLHWSYSYPAGNYDFSRNEIVPVAGIMWSFWFNDAFALYPKFEVGYAIGWVTGWNNADGPTPTYGAFFWDLTAGAMYKLSNGLTARLEVGTGDLKLGVGWLF